MLTGHDNFYEQFHHPGNNKLFKIKSELSDLPKICWDMSRQLEWSGIATFIEAVSHLPISARIQAGQWTGRMFRPNIAHKMGFLFLEHVPPCFPQDWSLGVNMWVSIVSWFHCCGSKHVWTKVIQVLEEVWEAWFFGPTSDAKFWTHPQKKNMSLARKPAQKETHIPSASFIFARVWFSGVDLFAGVGITGFVLSLPINQSEETFPDVGFVPFSFVSPVVVACLYLFPCFGSTHSSDYFAFCTFFWSMLLPSTEADQNAKVPHVFQEMLIFIRPN